MHGRQATAEVARSSDLLLTESVTTRPPAQHSRTELQPQFPEDITR